MDKDIKKHMDKNFMKGILKIMILVNLQKSKTHPYALLKKIKANKHIPMNITKNDLYNTMAAMEKEGLIKSIKSKNENMHKNFTITPKGKAITKKSKSILLSHILSMRKLIDEFNE